MRKHLLQDCKQLFTADRSTYIMQSAKSSNQEPSQTPPDTTGTPIIPQKRTASNPISQYFSTSVSGSRKKALDKKLLEALIVGNVPFNFVECPQFREYALSLGHDLPSRRTVSGSLLEDMFLHHFSEMLDELHAANDMTILLDGWTDVSGHSIYAYIGQTQESLFVLDICQFKQRPSADNIKSQLFDILKKLNLSTKQLLAVTTDTPQVMEKLRRDISSEHPNILNIKCGLHILNRAIQRAVKHQDLLETFKRNQTIVNFFTSSHYWLGRLRDWMRDNGVKKGLRTYTATRWYSAVQVALSVQGVEEGLMVCLGEGYAAQNPLPNKVSSILHTPDHFSQTRALVKLLKPLTDAIARLEKLNASLDQIFIAIITCYRQVQQTDTELEYQSWKITVMTAICSVARRFNNSTYFVALFLNPGWQTMAISRKYNVESITGINN